MIGWRMHKLIRDTLQAPNGKWSRKSLTMLVAFICSIILGAVIVISENINHYAIDVFDSFMLLVFGLSGISVIDKKVKNKAEDDAPS